MYKRQEERERAEDASQEAKEEKSPVSDKKMSLSDLSLIHIFSMFIAFGLLYWVTMSRIIRGQVLQLKQQEYVTAARALGASGGRIIRRHLLPNCR